MSELEQVINHEFDYMVLRKNLARLSGVPCMAITTDEHIRKIDIKISDQADEIKRLSLIVEKIKDLTA